MSVKNIIVSVIIPFYKEISLIGRAVESVCIQSVEEYDVDYEIVIGNDGDYSTEEIFAAIDEKFRCKVKVIKNMGPKGPGGARNCALEASTGECVAFLDADDYWLPEKIAAQLAQYSKGAKFIATAYRFEGGIVLYPPKISSGKKLKVFKNLGLGTSTVMVARSLIGNLRFRDIRFGQDIDFWHRLSQIEGFQYISISDCYVVYSTSGSTKNKVQQAEYFWKVLSLNDLPFFYKVDAFFRYGVRGVWNHFIR